MEQINQFVNDFLLSMGVSGDAVSRVCHVVLIIVAVLLAWFAGWLCKLFIPVINKLTAKTEAKWDDALFNERVLRSACQIVPALVIWQLLPAVFYDFPTVHEVLNRLTAIYITVMSVRTTLIFADSFRLLEDERRTSKQQYLYSFIGIMKIILIFIAVIVVISIILDKNPTKLFAGLGAASAIMMLVFQDTIKGLVAGIRLTSNDMVRVGDRITVPTAGADGIVEDISLTTVKVRNFDNTIITVTPQTLVDGSFQNWKGMKENLGRKAVRKVFFDFRSIKATPAAPSSEGKGATALVNLTRYREHMEQWLAKNPLVITDKPILVHQLDATPTGLPVEFVFWLHAQEAIPYEHAISEIMEYAYAASTDFDLRIYQQFPEQ
jgi:miniconductance mechanosensitive channel